jgi:putative Mg2+ transporter-C (MgtC) family protein
MFEFDVTFILQTALRMAYATVAGVILGLPFRLRPGGLRTHALVSVGTALFCVLGIGLPARYPSSDVSRIVQGIVQGIGFIGAATVIKHGESIVGVNTAASILVAAAVGCFIGIGHPFTGLVVAVIAMGVNFLLQRVEILVKQDHERRMQARGKVPEKPGV